MTLMSFSRPPALACLFFSFFPLLHPLWVKDFLFYLLYLPCHSEFYMDTNGANSFIFWYDISAVALAKFVALSKIPSGTFRNVLNAMIFVFSVAKLGKDLNGVCLEIIVLCNAILRWIYSSE